MKKLALTVVLTLFCGSASLGQTTVTQAEYGVYARVLRAIYKENRQTSSNESHFVILKRTQPDPELQLPSGRRYARLVSDFKKINLTSGIIERKFRPGAYSETYFLVTQNAIDDLFERGKIEFDRRSKIEKLDKSIVVNPGGTTWMPFYEKFPEASGYYTLSRVGFDGIFAMVQVQRDDVYYGFSRTYILKKVKGEWKIINPRGIIWMERIA